MPADVAFSDVMDDSITNFEAWQAHGCSIDARRRSQKPRWRVEARETAVESHISFIGRSVVDMADRTAHVANG